MLVNILEIENNLFETWGATFSTVSKDYISWLFFEGTIIWYLILFLAVYFFSLWNKKFNLNVELQQKIENFLPPIELIPFIAFAILFATFLYLPIATTIKNYQKNKIITPMSGDCDPSYPEVCIPTFPPDLDCGDIPYKNFKVLGSDPHWFDVDEDGLGCEKFMD